jgi:transcriptional regulator GlxA family with amidase domain
MAPARRVVVMVFRDVELLDLAGPINVFTAASRLARKGAGYTLELAARTPGAVMTAGGLEVVASCSLASLRGDIDTLVVPGGLLTAVDEAAAEAVPHVRRLAQRARRIAGVCTGAFLLARAGLLEGRRAATHWAACDELAARHPDCDVQRDPIFVHDGRIWTSAGVTAGIDLALRLVEDDHGPDLALEVARWLVLHQRRFGGQSQFSVPLRAQFAERDAIRSLVAWMTDNMNADLSVPALARRAAMSERNFARIFAAETGKTPAAFVECLRVEAARRKLEGSARSVKQIAAASGFGTVATMHRAFQRVLGVTPLQYRANVSA